MKIVNIPIIKSLLVAFVATAPSPLASPTAGHLHLCSWLDQLMFCKGEAGGCQGL